MVAGGGIERKLRFVLQSAESADPQSNQASTLVPQSKQGYHSAFRLAPTISSVGTHLVASRPPLAFQLDLTGASTGGQRYRAIVQDRCIGFRTPERLLSDEDRQSVASSVVSSQDMTDLAAELSPRCR